MLGGNQVKESGCCFFEFFEKAQVAVSVPAMRC